MKKRRTLAELRQDEDDLVAKILRSTRKLEETRASRRRFEKRVANQMAQELAPPSLCECGHGFDAHKKNKGGSPKARGLCTAKSPRDFCGICECNHFRSVTP